MSYDKKSPSNFGLGGLGATVAGVKGFFDKDLKGQGFGARLKNSAASAGNKLLGKDVFKTQDGQAEQAGMDGIHSKLDKLLSMGGQEDGAGATMENVVANDPNPQPQVDPSALSMKANAFTGTPQQSPYSNGTGGKNPTFNKDAAGRMMAVADPNTDTSGLMFAGPPFGEGVNIKPTIKMKKDDVGYQKTNVGVESNPVKISESAKIGFGVGVDNKSKKGYSSFSPSAKVKVKFDINKLWKNRKKKKEEPKFDW